MRYSVGSPAEFIAARKIDSVANSSVDAFLQGDAEANELVS